jgi:hypothetical protein
MEKLTKTIFFGMVSAESMDTGVLSIDEAYNEFSHLVVSMTLQVMNDGMPVFFTLSYARLELAQIQRVFLSRDKKKHSHRQLFEKSNINYRYCH